MSRDRLERIEEGGIDEHPDTGRSEFRYGTSVRAIRLPVNADAEHIQASYDSGVLEVEVLLLRDAEGAAGTSRSCSTTTSRPYIGPSSTSGTDRRGVRGTGSP